MKKKLALLLACAMVASLFVGCGSTTEPAAEPAAEEAAAEETTDAAPVDGTGINVTYGITNDWNTINFYADAPTAAIYMVCDKIYDKLFYKNAAGEILPRNASEWSWNDDQTELTITLNEGAKWHDGEPVTAYDWEYTYTLMCQPDAGYAKGSNNRFFVGTDENGFAVEGEELGIKATDDYTLVLTFKDPWSDIASMLQNTNLLYIPVIPKHILGDIPSAEVYKNEFFENPIGSGPCKFVSQVVNNELILEINQDYYLGAPNFETLTFKKMDVDTSLATFAQGGDLDIVFPRYNGDSAIEALTTYEQAGYVVEQDATPTRVTFVLINNQTVSDVRIRQAIQYCIDRDAICEQIMSGLAVPTTTYVSNNNPYKNNDIDYAPDKEKAKALVEEAGYSVDNPLTLKMDTVNGFRATIAALMQQELAEVGINLEVNTTDVATGFSEICDGTVDMAWIVDTSADNDLSCEWYYTADNGNYNSITDPSFGEKMEAIKELELGDDTEALKTAMYEWQEYIYEQAAMIPICFQYGVSARSPRLEGAALEDAVNDNDNIWDWQIVQ